MGKKQTNILVILASIASCAFLSLSILMVAVYLQLPQREAAIAKHTPSGSQPITPNQPSATLPSETVPTHVPTPLTTVTPTPLSKNTPLPIPDTPSAADIEALTNTIDMGGTGLIAHEACQVSYEKDTTIAKICADIPEPQFFRSVDGCVTVYFLPGVVAEDTMVIYKPTRWPYYDQRPLAAYELTAARLDGTPITEFDKGITIQLYYSYDGLPERLEETIAGFVWNEGTQDWDYTPTATDPAQNLALFRTTRIGLHVAEVTGIGSLKLGGTGPGKCNSPFAQPTPTRSTAFIVDIPNTLGRTVAELEQTLGPGEILEVNDTTSGQETLRKYSANNYTFFLVFDENGVARVFEIPDVMGGEEYLMDEWSLLLARLNLHPGIPDGQNYTGEMYFKNYNGYMIFIYPASTQRGPIASVWIASANYSPEYLLEEPKVIMTSSPIASPTFELLPTPTRSPPRPTSTPHNN
jgi:hypothetical protein